MSVLRYIACSIALLATVPTLSWADVVELKTGERVEGTFRDATRRTISIEVGGKAVTFEREKVRAIYLGAPPVSVPQRAAPDESKWVLWVEQKASDRPARSTPMEYYETPSACEADALKRRTQPGSLPGLVWSCRPAEAEEKGGKPNWVLWRSSSLPQRAPGERPSAVEYYGTRTACEIAANKRLREPDGVMAKEGQQRWFYECRPVGVSER